MKIKPIGERIVVKHVEVEKTTESGFILPTDSREKPKYAEVVEISSTLLDDEDKKDLIKLGDYVIYSNYSGTNIDDNGEEYTIVELEDVQAIVEL